MRSEANLQRFERYTEWPLAAAAIAHIDELRVEIRALELRLTAEKKEGGDDR